MTISLHRFFISGLVLLNSRSSSARDIRMVWNQWLRLDKCQLIFQGHTTQTVVCAPFVDVSNICESHYSLLHQIPQQLDRRSLSELRAARSSKRSPPERSAVGMYGLRVIFPVHAQVSARSWRCRTTSRSEREARCRSSACANGYGCWC